MQFAARDLRAHRGDLRQAAIGQQLVIAEHQIVADLHDLAEHHLRRFGDADVIAQRLRHLLLAVEAFENRHGGHDLLRLAVVLLHFAPHQQIEFLVRAAHFDVAFERHRIVSLGQRIQQLVHRNRHAFRVALGEIVALQDARHGVFRAQPDHVFEAQLVQPFAVEADLGFFRIENLEDLRLVGLGVGLDLLARQRRTRGVAAGGIADHGRAVADQEDDGVAEILEVLHLAQQHGVAEMQIGRGGVEAGLHAQRPAFLRDPLAQILFADQFGEAFFQIGYLFVESSAHFSYCRSGADFSLPACCP